MELVPLTSPVTVNVLGVARAVAVDAFPDRLAVIIPAAKSPLSSRSTIVFGND